MHRVPARRRCATSSSSSSASSTRRATCASSSAPNGAFQVKTDERIEHDPASAWAAVMLDGPNGEIEHTAAEGNGPVNALDTALRRALRRFYPQIEEVRLLDYKVRVLGGGEGSAAPVRVLIESGDGAGALGHRRRVAQRHRGELAGAGRQLRVQDLQGRQAGAAPASTARAAPSEPRAAREGGGAAAASGSRRLPLPMIYLDHNATTPLRRAVLEAMLPYLGECTGNAVERARARARRPGGGRAGAARDRRRGRRAARAEIVFTSGGTESNNLALLRRRRGAARRARRGRRRSSTASVLGPVRELARRGAQVTWLPVDGDGRVSARTTWRRRCAARPLLVSVGWANNEIGTVQPIAAIGALCRRARRGAARRRRAGARQAGGRRRRASTCARSRRTSSAGRRASARCSCAAACALRPLGFGGEQERGRAPGTENVAGDRRLRARRWRRSRASTPMSRELRERLWRGLAAIDGARRHSPADGSLAEHAERRLRRRARRGAGGGARPRGRCGLGRLGVRRRLGRSRRTCCWPSAAATAEARGGVRFSLGAATTAEEIAAVAAALRRVVERMRAVGAGPAP